VRAESIANTSDIDEAIWWVLLTAPRNIDHMKIVDALLDERNRLSADQQDQDAHPPEHRY
jgi:RPA family protein